MSKFKAGDLSEVYAGDIELITSNKARILVAGWGWKKGTICNVVDGPNVSGAYQLEPVDQDRVPLWWQSHEFEFITDTPLMEPEGVFEAVAHPLHYGGDTTYEAIKVIEAWGLGFHTGNATKYISRAGKKDKTKEIEDIDKAIWYLQRHKANLEDAVA